MRGSQPESMHRQGGSRMRTSHGQRRPVHDVTCMGRANRRRGTGPLPPPHDAPVHATCHASRATHKAGRSGGKAGGGTKPEREGGEVTDASGRWSEQSSTASAPEAASAIRRRRCRRSRAGICSNNTWSLFLESG